MGREIAIVTTEFLRDFVTYSMKDLDLDIDYKIYPYTTFSDLKDIYLEIPDHVSGIITSGEFPLQVIKKNFPDSQKILRAFNNDDAGIYKLFLQLMNKYRDLDVSRIYADILDIFNMDINAYLFSNHTMIFANYVKNFIKEKSLDELLQAEEEYLQKHLSLWEAGKTDISITRFSSIASKLKKAGVPVYFAFPSLTHLESVCLNTIKDMNIRDLRGNQMASIVINIQDFENSETPTQKFVELQNVLQKFNNIYQLSYVMHRQQHGYEILTKLKVVEFITDRFTTCHLQEFLKDKLDFNVCIGYGIGVDMYQARINAVDANREANLLPHPASSLINDKDELISPLHGEAQLVIPREVPAPIREVANNHGISYLTIQKVFAAVRTMPDYQITSQELAHKLLISRRSANRFLSALKDAGLCQVVELRQVTTMGRPERVYKITSELLQQ